MLRIYTLGIVRLSVCAGAVVSLVLAPPRAAQTMVGFSAEARFQLDLEVPEVALAGFLPSGWTPNISMQGNAKDANLRAIFIDRVTINGPDGAPVGASGSGRLVYLVAPVTSPAGANVQLSHRGTHGGPDGRPGSVRQLSIGHHSQHVPF